MSAKRIDTSIDVQKITPILLDDILNELRMIRRALVDQGIVRSYVVNIKGGDEKVLNENPTTYYKDVDIVNRGPGSVVVRYELLTGQLPTSKILRTEEITIEGDETDSLSFNEPRIGKVWIRALGDTVLKVVFTA